MRYARHIGFKLGCLLVTALAVTACTGGPPQNNQIFQPQPGQGQYVRPLFLEPELTERLPLDDLCQARIYRSLIGQFEGGLYFQAIPGRQRILKEAFTEDFEDDFLPEFEEQPPFVEVREFIAGQPLFAGSIRTTPSLIAIEQPVQDRLTIEINIDGIVEDVRCG